MKKLTSTIFHFEQIAHARQNLKQDWLLFSLNRSFHTRDDKRSVLPRLIVGLVFLSEGIQKFLFPELVGTGRFEKIGFSNPEFWACFTGTFEIICSFLVLIGLLTRLASIPLLVIMITAFVTTKVPILADKGFWAMAHEYRTDFAMTILLLYLIIYGPGNGRWIQKLPVILKKSNKK